MVSFILVHISETAFPTHIYDAIEQIRLFNEENPVYLVINKNCPEVNYSRLDFYGCNIVYIEDLSETEQHKYFRSKRQGEPFWVRTQERFFVLEEVMYKLGLYDVVHIENDNLIYVDIDSIYKEICENFSGFAVPYLGTRYCCASLCFIRNWEDISKYNEYCINDSIINNTNDMETLKMYFLDRGMNYLPTTFTSYFSDSEKIREHSYCADKLKGIFDAALIGQYIGGVEKRTYKEIMEETGLTSSKTGIIPHVNVNTSVKAEDMNIQWTRDDHNRFVPYACPASLSYRIFNLHVHSKELFRFRSNNKYVIDKP